MSVFSSYLEKLGSNFIVSSMVPSLALVIVSLMVFDPTLISLSAFRDFEDTPRLIVLAVFVVILAVIIGFTLTALNTFILKMFEGYIRPFPVRIAYFLSHRKHQKKAQTLSEQRDLLESQIRELKKRVGNDPVRQAELDGLIERHYKAAAEYGLMYPEDISDVMPSRFGNVLKAAENYPGERYGFDGVQFWPRLVHVIPADYRTNIDNTRNELSFLANMSILSAVFSFLSVVAIFFSMAAVSGAGTDPKIYYMFWEAAGKYLLFAGIGFAFSYFFYNASILSVGSFALIVRSSFDLFRLELLKELDLERPKDSIQEFKIWNNLNELIVLGSHSLKYTKLDYREKE